MPESRRARKDPEERGGAGRTLEGPQAKMKRVGRSGRPLCLVLGREFWPRKSSGNNAFIATEQQGVQKGHRAGPQDLLVSRC